MGEQETQETREAQGPREIGEGREEESFRLGGATYRGPVMSRYGRLVLALDLFRLQVRWIEGYLFVVSEHFESRGKSISAETAISYLDEVPAVATDVEGALADVESRAADLRRAMAGETPGGPPPTHVCVPSATRAADLSPEVDAGEELSYRRGYQHGWQHALGGMLRLLRAGREPEEAYRVCSEFNNGELSGWRFGDCARRQRPPVLDGEEEEGQ